MDWRGRWIEGRRIAASRGSPAIMGTPLGVIAVVEAIARAAVIGVSVQVGLVLCVLALATTLPLATLPPAGAALAWWLIATVGFSGGYFTAALMDSAVSGQIPQRMRQFLIAVGVLVLAGAGQAASAPSPIPTISGVLAGLAALCLGALMAFCGAHFALRKA